MNKLKYLLIILGLNFYYVHSNNPDHGGWFMYFGNAKIENFPFKLHYEFQYRNHNITHDVDQILSRFGFQYTPIEQIILTSGYGFIQSEQIGEINSPKRENRIYQEALFPLKINSVRLQHRLRYEQRFFEESIYKTRYRYMLSLFVPIKKFDSSDRKLFANIYNEVFINGKSELPNKEIFDRNRLYLGAGFKLNPNFTMQLGWMNQMFSEFSQPKIIMSLHHNISI